MRTVTNFFLLNLSLADLLMATLNCVFNFIFMLNSDWPFGAVYCTINNFIANVSVGSSVFTLVAITLDRLVGGKANCACLRKVSLLITIKLLYLKFLNNCFFFSLENDRCISFLNDNPFKNFKLHAVLI